MYLNISEVTTSDNIYNKQKPKSVLKTRQRKMGNAYFHYVGFEILRSVSRQK